MTGRLRRIGMASTAAAALAGGALAGPAPARAALLPGYYVIQAQKPPGRYQDRRQFYVTPLSSSTTQPVKLEAPITDSIQGQRQQWQLDQQSITFQGHSHTAYILVNRYYRGCLTWIAPLMGNGTRVGMAAYPQNCPSWPQRWVLNNGSRWVTINDPHGTSVGFQLNIPVRPGTVYCLDVTGFRYLDDTPMQEWRCTGNWNQRFFLRRVAG